MAVKRNSTPKPKVARSTAGLPDMINSAVLAELAHLTRRSISSMTAKGIITAGKDNLYPTVQSIQQLIDFYRSDKANLKNEKLRLEAEMLQLQVDKEKGFLLPIDTVSEIIRVVVASYVTKLRELPTKIAKLVNPHDIDLAEEVLTEEAEKLIASMKKDMEKQLQRDIEKVDEEEPIIQDQEETEDTEDDTEKDE